MQWQKRPILYEIHTWAWLADLSARYRRAITLGSVPAAEWDALAGLRVDAVWLMGVWQRSPTGVAVANDNPNLQAEFRRALDNYTPSDNIGSAYCIRDYVVDERIGGQEGLANAREQLRHRNLGLVLDYVPNHVARDHAWVETHPEFLLQGTQSDLERAPGEFFEAHGRVFANGRDPYLPPWRDVVQANAFDKGFRAAALEIVQSIAAQCDGMRVDMAMLLLNHVFTQTWGARAGDAPATEFWRELLPTVKRNFPDVLFVAEVYWDLEYELMEIGFDYCYDKRLYDKLAHQDATSVRQHLFAGIAYQDRLVRFIENHDEARAAVLFSPPQERAAALISTTLPGAKLLYEGQLDGRKIKTPVFFTRRMTEPTDFELALFYRALLRNIHSELFHAGEWNLCECSGWIDNDSFKNMLAWTWHRQNTRALIVVNYSAQRSQAMIQLPWADLENRVWRLTDALNGDLFLRDGNQLSQGGLYVDLDAWRFHFLTFE